MIKKIMLAFLLFPSVVFAQDEVVTCNGLDCSVCSLLETISNAFGILLTISFALSILFIILGGYLYITANDKEKAKKFIQYSIIGFSAVLISFLVVNFTLYSMGAKNQASWYNFECNIEKSEGDDDNSRKDTAYLNHGTGVIVDATSFASITYSEDRIAKFDLESLEAQEFLRDLLNADSRTRIKLLTATKGTGNNELIDYRNLDFGFSSQEVDLRYELSKRANKYIGDEMLDTERKIEEIATIEIGDASINITGNNEYNNISGQFAWGDKKDLNTLERLIQTLLNKLIKDLDVDLIGFTQDEERADVSKCVDSEGEWTEFRNVCTMEKEIYGNDVECSDVDKPVFGCKCPEGKNLVNNECISSNFSTSEDSDKDGVEDAYDLCFNTVSGAKVDNDPSSKYFGCSCSQIDLEDVECPPSRCEGDDLYVYPESGEGKCTENYSSISIQKTDCSKPLYIEENNTTCVALNDGANENTIAQNDPSTYDKIKDSLNEPGDNDPNNPSDGSTSNNGTSQEGEPTPQQPDLGPGKYKPSASFKELKECIGFKDDQIPYNGVFVALLDPEDPLNRRHHQNISKIFYLTREGKVIGFNGQVGDGATRIEGQPYGARTFDKGASNRSMWGPGWKAFNGCGTYTSKSGWHDKCSIGTHTGFKIGPYVVTSNNLGGGKVYSMGRCGTHAGNSPCSSRGCATLGNRTRCGFVNGAKKYITKNDCGVLQISIKGQYEGAKLSADCGKANPCAAVASFKKSNARKYVKDLNDGYDSGDKRRVKCPNIGLN